MKVKMKLKLTSRVLVFFIILFQALLTKAQTNTFPSTGNVGIGTTNPFALLSVYRSTGSTSLNNGYPAIEVNNPNTVGDANTALILRSGTVLAAGVQGAVGGLYGKATDNAGQYIWLRSFSASYPIYVGFNKSDMVVVNGNVLIGQTSQVNTSYKLDVNGTIRADQVVVNTTGADYVFDSSYRLSPLTSVEIFLKTYHHLPGIQSAKEMQDNGLKVGENQIQLLKKIEELTLYSIEQDKSIEILKEQMQKQQEQIEKLEFLIKQSH